VNVGARLRDSASKDLFHSMTMAYGRRNFIAYQRTGSTTTPSTKSLVDYRNKTITFLLATALYTAFLYRSGGAGSFLGNSNADPAIMASADRGIAAMYAAGRRLSVTTWNIAAINNNPFEYWITYKENPDYENLMVQVEHFLENPGDKDVAVSNVFTEEMFSRLEAKMAAVGWQSVKSYWDGDFKNRKIISEFMKDPVLGNKRLASMPDRITNTINEEGNPEPICRPTVINMYDGDLGSLDKWFAAWEAFMFTRQIKIKTENGVEAKIPYSMLQPIKKAKYPEISEQEEVDSLPLQTMCGAIFDAILVHMMNTVSSPDVWQPLKRLMVENLNKKKVSHTLQILESQYIASDIVTLQEVSSSFIDKARVSGLGQHFHIVAPAALDAVRDQNSVIFLSKTTFPGGASSEITALVEKAFPEGGHVPVAKGDILAITTTNVDGVPFVVASFHGDTDGLATKPVLSAIIEAMRQRPELVSHKLIFGLDANTYEHAKPKKQQDVMDWGIHYVKQGLTSCWGDKPNPSNYTTYNARTFLQPQLNKACKQEEKREKGDVNPKDFILFSKKDFEVVQTWKDNTGMKEYIEDMAFPTLNFPSDHGILATIVQVRAPTN